MHSKAGSTHHAFLARVLVGQHCKGKSDFRLPPLVQTEKSDLSGKSESKPDKNSGKLEVKCEQSVVLDKKCEQSVVIDKKCEQSDEKCVARYDSTVDDVTKPAEFVIFSSNQTYPEYLVTFST